MISRSGPPQRPATRGDDPELGYEFVPGSRRGHLRINAHGFRGPETDEDAVPRISCGSPSSATRRHSRRGCPRSGRSRAAVQDLLNRNSTGVRYEALNFGVPGYNTAQELRVLQTRVLPFRPAFVVLYYVFNDPEMQSRTLLLGSTPLSRSYLYMFAAWSTRIREGRLGELKRRHPEIVDYYRALHESEYFEATKALIREMGRELERRGIELIVVIAPEIIGYVSFDAYPYEEIHAELRGSRLRADHRHRSARRPDRPGSIAAQSVGRRSRPAQERTRHTRHRRKSIALHIRGRLPNPERGSSLGMGLDRGGQGPCQDLTPFFNRG